jgi:uncharacterized protein (DUF1499 family)
MTPLAWLLGLFLPACAATGAQGLPVPSLMDMAHIERPASPNTALAAPEGFSPPPDLTTPVYHTSAPRLYAAVEVMAAAQPRTYRAAAYPDQLQVHYVVRSAVFNFPDLVAVQITPDGADNSHLVVYSRSIYGHSDLGVNRKRLEVWLAALQSTLPPSPER